MISHLNPMFASMILSPEAPFQFGTCEVPLRKSYQTRLNFSHGRTTPHRPLLALSMPYACLSRLLRGRDEVSACLEKAEAAAQQLKIFIIDQHDSDQLDVLWSS